MRKILLWKFGALGDVIMTTPLVRQLRRAMPQAHIGYLVGRGSAGVLQDNPHLDEILTFDERILAPPAPWRLGEIVARLRGWDAVLVLDKHWIFALLARVAGVPVRVGFARSRHEGALHTHRVPYGAIRSEVDCNLDLLQAMGHAVDRADRAADVPAPQPSPVTQPYVVLCNSGGNNSREQSAVRRMPAPLFAALVAQVAGRSRCVFLGAASEANDYAAFSVDGHINLCGRTSLPEALGVLAGADAVICTDSGVLHMAGAVNPQRTTCVFGPTHPARKCPPGVRAVWGDEAIYDPRYETSGRLPGGGFFTSLQAREILARAGL